MDFYTSELVGGLATIVVGFVFVEGPHEGHTLRCSIVPYAMALKGSGPPGTRHEYDELLDANMVGMMWRSPYLIDDA